MKMRVKLRVTERLKLANTTNAKVIFGKMIHDLLSINPVQLFDIAYREEIGGDVASVKKRRQKKTHLWGCKDAYCFEVRRSLPMEKPMDVWWRSGRSLTMDWNGF